MAEAERPPRRAKSGTPPPNVGLSDDVLLKVFRRLGRRRDKEAAALVCKRWLQVVCTARRSARIWRADATAFLVQRCPNLTSIDCSGTIHMEDVHVMALAERYTTKLTSLDLSFNKKVTEKGLKALGVHCGELLSLTLTAGTYGDVAIMRAAACAKLQRLCLTNCRAVSDVGISCVAARCKVVEELSLHWCMGITDESIEVVVLNCPLLKILDLSYTKVSSTAMSALSQAPALESLLLAACTQVDDHCLRLLAQGPCPLKSLDVSGCKLVTDAGVGAFAEAGKGIRELLLGLCPQVSDGVLPLVAKLPHLSVLRLEHNAITNAGLLAFQQAVAAASGDAASEEASCPDLEPAGGLRKLNLARCLDVSALGLEPVLRLPCLQHLERLNLTCCKEVGDELIKCLALQCRNLRVLLVEACRGITNEGLLSLVAGCPDLEQLDLTDCQLGEEGLLALGQCSSLQMLKLGFCVGVTDAVLQALGANCHALHHLDLYRCSGFGPPGLAAIGRGCTDLRELNLSYCRDGVTNISLQAFSQGHGAASLQNLEMRGCRAVTALGLAAIAMGCKELEELDLKKCTGISDIGFMALSEGCQYLRQVNLSYCCVGDDGLECLARMPCMVKFNLIHCNKLSIHKLCTALAKCRGLKKVKLVPAWKDKMDGEQIAELESRGCTFRWMEKPVDIL